MQTNRTQKDFGVLDTEPPVSWGHDSSFTEYMRCWQRPYAPTSALSICRSVSYWADSASGSSAPRLAAGNMAAAAALNWHEISLQGDSAQEYGEQLTAIDDILVDGWEVKVSEKTGNPRYVRPSVLVIFREDNRFLLDSVIPRRGQVSGDYDLILAAQPWRARMSAQFKAEKVHTRRQHSMHLNQRLRSARDVAESKSDCHRICTAVR